MNQTRLEQKKSFGRKNSYELRPNYEIAVSVKGLGRFENWTMTLAGFDPDPIRIRRIEWKPLVVVVPVSGIGLYMIALGVLAPITGDDPLSCIVTGLVLLLIALPFLLIIILRPIDILSFQSRGGSHLTFWHNKPSKDVFDRFINELKEAICKAQPDDKSPSLSDRSITAEIQKLTQLFEQGSITEAQFEAGKNKVLGLDKTERIGF